MKTNLGDRYKNRFVQWCTVVAYNNSQDVEVVFDSHPKDKQSFPSGALRKGSFRNKLDPVNMIGKKFKSNSGEYCTALFWEDAYNVVIEFEGFEGVHQKVTSGNLRKGEFSNPESFDVKEGFRFKNLRDEWCTVIEYRDSKNVVVVFDGFEENKKLLRSDHLREGRFKNNYQPVIHGVGYIGEGKYRPRDSMFMKMVHDTWKNMIARGYNEETKQIQPTYRDVTVCKEWHNFQNFAEWMVNHDFWNFGYQLDKDLIIRGNSVYSKDTCTLLPREINAVLSIKRSGSSDTPTGVYKTGEKYLAKSHLGENGVKILGYFLTVEEASAAYVKAKEAYIHSLAEKWKGKIEDRAYQALLVWKVYPDETLEETTDQQAV